MDNFTFFDWLVAGAILLAGLVAATVKVFVFDDPEIKETKKRLER